MIRRCRGDLPITINTTYSSPFDIPPLSAMRQRYHPQDPAYPRELYAVLNAKPFLLDEAVRTLASQGREYGYAFWHDAGSFRDAHKYVEWPSPERVEVVWKEGSALSGENPEDLMFFPVAGMPPTALKTWAQPHGPVDVEFSEGEFGSIRFPLVKPATDVRAQARFSVDHRALWRGGARPSMRTTITTT
jgi:hypothetical protein